MPTYGEKWRARSNSSAYDLGHVSRSHQTPFLRLDSTGEVTSVDHTSQENRTQSYPEMNGNIVNMKSWVTNRVLGCNGLTGATNLTGKTTNINTDLNANILDRIVDTMPGSTVNAMESRYPNPKLTQPQCGFSGWNYSGQGIRRDMYPGGFGVFPCHQFINSFNFAHGSTFRHLGKMDMIPNQEVSIAPAMCWSQVPVMEDKYWHQRPWKCDRSYRGHSPKHHKHEHIKHVKIPSEHVSSKCSGKGSQKQHCDTDSEICVESQSGLKSHLPKSKCNEVAPTVETTSVKRSNQIKPDQIGFYAVSACRTETDEHENNNNGEEIGAHELHVPKESAQYTENRKKTFICGITQDRNQMLTVNITDSSKCQSEDMKDSSSSERSSSEEPDPCKQESNIQVLFVRKDKKKGRPSSGKQRRRKLQKAKCASSCNGLDKSEDSKTVDSDCDSMDSVDHNTASSENEKKTRCSATVSFILGLSQSPTSPNMPNGTSAKSSYVFSFSDDESDMENDDNWDIDSDFNIEANFSQCDLFNFLPKNNCGASSPLNFQVHISPVQNRPDTQEKTIEDINTSWNVEISLKEATYKAKKNSTKKVHFPDDKDLSVVHPMITWSYAYQAARKGHWENFVRDRDRFKRRILDLENVLVPIFDSNHRNMVYVNRFEGMEN